VLVCLVTGSSRGFGRLICEHLAASGHRVYASMRATSGPGAELAETCELVELDVSDGDSVQRAVKRIVDREGRLDVVVNNAGYVLWGPIEETPIEEIQREFDVNVFGALRVARAAAPVMRQQGSGVVVQMSSISGRVVAGPFWGHYAASKFALEAFSEALAYELRPFGIRVVLVEPGSYDTTIDQSVQRSPGLAEGHSAYDDAYRRMREVDEPWELGDPNEVAQAVVRTIEDDSTPLRVLLGDDAAWYIEAKTRGDEEYRREIWQLWRLPE
jgi:NAD(P)-dependent dehydrogenase (short-subunit alcohol dehydrogenase family)